ncbi:hypothetical protein [Cupriavidus oxalaticus]|uniref:hypothetical protein n=1 Tax=Cupriavidus oxalaticus TaxID=96344 RepID=UPI00197AAC81|nr:hypothetical protein [Cupriavidus oxalaticus]
MDPQNTTDSITLADAEQLIEQLNALQPGKQQQKAGLFKKLYPAIERALGRQVPQKAILAHLSSMGLFLSIGGFRSLLESERKQRTEKGENVRCNCCGSVLPASSDAAKPVGNVSLASLCPKDATPRGS